MSVSAVSHMFATNAYPQPNPYRARSYIENAEAVIGERPQSLKHAMLSVAKFLGNMALQSVVLVLIGLLCVVAG